MNAKVIDHQQAIKNMMAERYLLGELSEADLEAYEAHLFDCQICFDQIKAGTELVGHLRKIGQEKPATAGSQPTGWWAGFMNGFRQPVAAFATALCVFAIGLNIYQYHNLSQTKGPALERSYVLTGIAHGGESAKVIEVPANSTLSLQLEYNPRGEFIAYGVRILSESGLAKSSLPIPQDQVDGLAKVAVPANSLGAGRYSIMVWGRKNDGTENEIARGTFELRFSQ
ncbi:MAG TPA: zf-HC2 domain-containing protein [Candidatus Angelobacter sp.]|nr:zf-HC2 domain-containing protein [Candidatus Angelobacter sp.]